MPKSQTRGSKSFLSRSGELRRVSFEYGSPLRHADRTQDWIQDEGREDIENPHDGSWVSAQRCQSPQNLEETTIDGPLLRPYDAPTDARTDPSTLHGDTQYPMEVSLL